MAHTTKIISDADFIVLALRQIMRNQIALADLIAQHREPMPILQDMANRIAVDTNHVLMEKP